MHIFSGLKFYFDYSKEDVENCKNRDMLEELIAEMVGEYPSLGEVFVRERDIFLTHSLQMAALPVMTSPNNGIGKFTYSYTFRH